MQLPRGGLASKPLGFDRRFAQAAASFLAMPFPWKISALPLLEKRRPPSAGWFARPLPAMLVVFLVTGLLTTGRSQTEKPVDATFAWSAISSVTLPVSLRGVAVAQSGPLILLAGGEHLDGDRSVPTDELVVVRIEQGGATPRLVRSRRPAARSYAACLAMSSSRFLLVGGIMADGATMSAPARA